MKKNDLLSILNNIPGNPEIIMSKDSEGNGYSPCANYMYPAKYIPETTWSGNVYNPVDLDKYEEEMCKDPAAIDAIVLYPTN